MAAALLVVAASVVVTFVERYPGLSAGLADQLRDSNLEETRNLWDCLAYLAPFLEKLTLNPATGIYDFERTPDAGLDDYERGRLAYHRGRFAEAEALFERRLRDRGESNDALFWLALAQMREAETENCLTPLRRPPAPGRADDGAPERAGYCSLPLHHLHADPVPSRRAARTLERLLDREGADGPDGRLATWLLDFTFMTVGGFPDQVPDRYLIRSPFLDAFYGEEAERRRRAHADLVFVDRARELGVDNFGSGRGVAVEDLDGDGDLDLVTANSFGRVGLFLNPGDGGPFTDAGRGSGLEGALQPLSISVADYDGDGDMDLFVVCPYTHYHLFANRGDATFDDVTESSGLLDPLPAGALAASWISAWGDVDNDGDLDLFVTGWAFRVPGLSGLAGRPRLDTKLFVNEGGRFRDATAELGLDEFFADRLMVGAAFGDYDGDGWIDLYATGPIPGTSVLLRNLSGRRFVPSDALAWTEPGFTAAFVDVDQDGRLDLFQGAFTEARTAVTAAVFDGGKRDLHRGRNAIFLQRPDGRFEPRPELFEGADMPIGSMGASFGDLDGDGCLDFYLGTGGPEPWFVLPNLMYRGVEEADGRCGGRMVNVSMLDGFGTVQKGHGIAFFDFDGDGDQDVYSSLGGMWPADPWPSQLFVNEGTQGNAWVKVRLRGRRSNRFGVGSLLTVAAHRADGGRLVRTYLLDQKTGFGSAPALAHVGLERAVAIDGVTVRWQGSGCVGTYPARIDALNVLDEAECLESRAAEGAGQAAPTGTPAAP